MTGRKVWFFPDAELPPPGDGEIQGHESVIILNPNAQPAKVEITLYWTTGEPDRFTVDVEPEAESPRTEDVDGRAQTLGSALDPLGAEHVSVDGWGLPLTPVEHRPDVPGARHGADELSISLNPGTVTVFTLSQS